MEKNALTLSGKKEKINISILPNELRELKNDQVVHVLNSFHEKSSFPIQRLICLRKTAIIRQEGLGRGPKPKM